MSYLSANSRQRSSSSCRGGASRRECTQQHKTPGAAEVQAPDLEAAINSCSIRRAPKRESIQSAHLLFYMHRTSRHRSPQARCNNR
jgi:hypothetical protein